MGKKRDFRDATEPDTKPLGAIPTFASYVGRPRRPKPRWHIRETARCSGMMLRGIGEGGDSYSYRRARYESNFERMREAKERSVCPARREKKKSLQFRGGTPPGVSGYFRCEVAGYRQASGTGWTSGMCRRTATNAC